MTPFLTNSFIQFPACCCCCCPTGSWKFLARTTLCGAAGTIDVSSIPDKEYYQVLLSAPGFSATMNSAFRLGNCTIDSGCNYANRRAHDGCCMSFTSSAIGINRANENTATQVFIVENIQNRLSQEKLGQSHTVIQSTAGAGTFPHREEQVGKWVDTCCVIDIMQWEATGSPTFDACSEVVVLGWDSTDTHTTACNFWQELTSKCWSSGATITTDTFTPKKYLKIGIWTTTATAGNEFIRVGNTTVDTCMNYATRRSLIGAADTTGLCSAQSHAMPGGSTARVHKYQTWYAVNIACMEKLFIGELIDRGTAGAATEPARAESVFKWVDTCCQIDVIQALTLCPDYTAGQIKVWGSD